MFHNLVDAWQHRTSWHEKDDPIPVPLFAGETKVFPISDRSISNFNAVLDMTVVGSWKPGIIYLPDEHKVVVATQQVTVPSLPHAFMLVIFMRVSSVDLPEYEDPDSIYSIFNLWNVRAGLPLGFWTSHVQVKYAETKIFSIVQDFGREVFCNIWKGNSRGKLYWSKAPNWLMEWAHES